MRAPLLALLAPGLGCVEAPPPDLAEGEGEGEGELPPDSTEELPFDTWPCERLDAFPHQLISEMVPVRVHYRLAVERPAAEEVVAFLEEGFVLEMDELGMAEPLLDAVGDGTFGCGPDERLDVFLWAGHEESFVDVVTEFPATPTEDWATMMVLDPWGPYGGAALRATTLHELHHMSQAALDWWDAAVVYEMSATFVEDVIADGAHFERGALYPEVRSQVLDASASTSVVVRPARLGSAYLELSGTGTVTVELSGVPAATRVVVEQLPGEAADGEELALPAAVALPTTIVITPLPSEATDHESRSTAPLALTVALAR